MGKEMIRQLKRSNIYRKYVFDEDDDRYDKDEFYEEETPSVQDLIEFLSQFPKDMSVLGAWEGQWEAMEGALVNKDANALVINVDASQVHEFEDESLEF